MTSNFVRRTAPLLLLASFAQAADPPTYFPCQVIGRPGHVGEDGSVNRERSPQELAAMAFRACDLVAWGRFVSVCDDNYHRTQVLNAEVGVKFAVEDTLFGERHEFLRTRMSREMLVWPDTNLSWSAHGYVSGRERILRTRAATNGQDLLAGIYESGTPMSGEQYERLSELFDQASSHQLSPSRKETVLMMSKQTFISHGGLSFLLEMGAVTPERRFLVGFSEPVDPAKGMVGFDALSSMIFWGQEAEHVAEQIRMLSTQGADSRPEEG